MQMTQTDISQKLHNHFLFQDDIFQTNDGKGVSHQFIHIFIDDFEGIMVVFEDWLNGFIEKCYFFAEDHQKRVLAVDCYLSFLFSKEVEDVRVVG